MKMIHATTNLLVPILLASLLAGQETVVRNPDDDLNPQPLDPKTEVVAPAPNLARLKTGAPNDWFEHTQLQLGDHLNKETIKGGFKFKNPHGVVIQFKNFSGSCQCARADILVGGRKYTLTKHPKNNALHRIEMKDGVEIKKPVTLINVGPGDAGEIVVHMDMAGIQGRKEATLQFTTTDKKYPLIILTWEAVGVKLFNISPSDFFLNDMKWGEQKSFRFQISSSVKRDFKLLGLEPLPDYVKVEKKQIKLPDGTPAWEVSGTFGPKADPKSGGAAIKFKTDLDDKVVTFTLIANVVGPVSVKPGTFIPFGRVTKAKGAERQVTISPNGDFELQVQKVEFERLKIDRKYLEVTHEKKGKDVVVTLRVLPVPGAKRLLLMRGVMIVYLNHPAVKTQRFSFNGILR